MSFFNILLYDFKFSLNRLWRSVPLLRAFNLRNILSRYLIEFKIPLVIHCDNLCLCFLNFTVFGSKMLDFCIHNNFFEMLIIFIWITKEIAVHFKSIKLWFNFIMKCLKRACIGTVDLYEFRYMPSFLQYVKKDRYGKWSDIQDLTTH